MKLDEAYSILEIPEGTSKDDAKKKFRQLSKLYHPDVNKEPDAEAKFKKINEAYQVVSTGKSTDPQTRSSRSNVNPFSQAFNQIEHIELNTTISFKDAVLGTKQELKFNRKTKCTDCNGIGEIKQNNGCDKCQGRGQIVDRQGYMVTIQTCPKCYGRTNSDPCNTCNAEGVLEAEAAISVTIPGGVQTGNVLRLGGMGNYAGNFGPLEQHSDVYLYLTVTPEPGLRLEGRDVVSTLQISLLDALVGGIKSVKTILGDQTAVIKPKSKNKEEVIIPHVGVNGQGNQRVILDVQYPEDVSELINALFKEGK